MLSAMAAPPQKRTELIALLSIICVVLVFAAMSNFQTGQSLTGVIDASLAVGLAVILAASYTRQNNSYNAAIKVYNNTRVCQRCGEFYAGNIAAIKCNSLL
jgi:hypothetical protein